MVTEPPGATGPAATFATPPPLAFSSKLAAVGAVTSSGAEPPCHTDCSAPGGVKTVKPTAAVVRKESDTYTLSWPDDDTVLATCASMPSCAPRPCVSDAFARGAFAQQATRLRLAPQPRSRARNLSLQPRECRWACTRRARGQAKKTVAAHAQSWHQLRRRRERRRRPRSSAQATHASRRKEAGSFDETGDLYNNHYCNLCMVVGHVHGFIAVGPFVLVHAWWPRQHLEGSGHLRAV